MLSGLKFIPRDQIDQTDAEKSHDSRKRKNRSSHSKEKSRSRKTSRYSNSSEDEELEKVKKSSSKKKWYSSEEYSASSSSGSESESRYEKGKRKHRTKKRDKKQVDSSDDAGVDPPVDDQGAGCENDVDIVRKEMGLEWMLRPDDRAATKSSRAEEQEPEKPENAEMLRVNPKELNPYFKDNGSGYPEEQDQRKSAGDQLLSSSVVGDGGASWRLKALKRAQEQATREGRKLEEVVEERWGSMRQFTGTVASRAAAPSRAHLHAIKSRRKGLTDEPDNNTNDLTEKDNKKSNDRDYLKDVSVRRPDMRMPKVQDSLSWRTRKGSNTSTRDSGIVSAALSTLNKFSNDGSFILEFQKQQNTDEDGPSSSSIKIEKNVVSTKTNDTHENSISSSQELSANQLAAKALQLRLKGKHEEAETLLIVLPFLVAWFQQKEAEIAKTKQVASDGIPGQWHGGSRNRSDMHNKFHRQEKEEDSDRILARKIMQSRQYNVAGRADEEYDFDDDPGKSNRKKGQHGNHNLNQKINNSKRIVVQHERCQFCFENPTRPKHLVVSIGNFTYLMLPQWQAVVPGHCCILPMQHESSTRTVDDNVWDEIRNFKKCLIMMFAKQEKDLVFLETVIGLAQQRRHCLVECIPLPRDIAKEAPLYFKKAIDEAEDEWSQHNAKKLIDTSVKGLRHSIPKDFPYFHVEFGLTEGFVHVIDDEKQFKSSFGLNVIRGMLRLPEEDMHRRRRQESFEAQKQAVTTFVQDWEPFDWTKQLD
ncbi:Cwf19-like protein, C-terminal domain-2 [Dillenia turbinata]|uniref:Cwf19-like protein, C-terminal domain-2 n=1 Tax=Dillenia turbinata TaxID=194707 RepID=A0AAN8ZAB2_9MAGN